MKNPTKANWRTEIIPIILLVISFLAAKYFYSMFPDVVPIHWNMSGQPDNYGSKLMSAWLFPFLIFFVYILFSFLPYLDPRKERYEQFGKTYHVFKNILIIFLVFVYFLTSFNILGYNISIQKSISLAVGILFVVMGNYMGKIKPNWFMGIRTPWTLSSENTWNKTHRFGGKAFVLAGFLLAISGFVAHRYTAVLFFSAVFIAVVPSFIYSYIVYNREKNKNNI